MSDGTDPSTESTASGHVTPSSPDQGRTPQLWLTPGPMLPKRTWQRSSRLPVILLTVLASIGFAIVALFVLLGGCVNATFFTAKGGVVCPSQTTTSRAIGPGTPVVIYDETGGVLARTALGNPEQVDDRCELRFTATEVVAGHGTYVVRVGDLFQENVSESALLRGAVLRPVP